MAAQDPFFITLHLVIAAAETNATLALIIVIAVDDDAPGRVLYLSKSGAGDVCPAKWHPPPPYARYGVPARAGHPCRTNRCITVPDRRTVRTHRCVCVCACVCAGVVLIYMPDSDSATPIPRDYVPNRHRHVWLTIIITRRCVCMTIINDHGWPQISDFVEEIGKSRRSVAVGEKGHCVDLEMHNVKKKQLER